MELSQIVLNQTLTMFLYMLLGYLLFKYEKVDTTGSGAIASLLLWLVIPSSIINSFCVPFSARRMQGFLVSALLGLIAILIAGGVSWVFFHRRPLDQFAATFSNASFIGIPLIQACLGSEAVFYLVSLIVFINVGQWTIGATIIQHDICQDTSPKITARKFFYNPITLSAIVGFVLFVTRLGGSLPSILSGCIQGVTALNAPLAMIILGVYLAQTELKSLVTEPALYLVSLVRLVIIPLLTLAVFAFIPADEIIQLTLLIAAGAPAGSNVSVYAQVYGSDYTYACKTVTQSTVLSILSLPALIGLAQMIL